MVDMRILQAYKCIKIGIIMVRSRGGIHLAYIFAPPLMATLFYPKLAHVLIPLKQSVFQLVFTRAKARVINSIRIFFSRKT